MTYTINTNEIQGDKQNIQPNHVTLIMMKQREFPSTDLHHSVPHEVILKPL